MELHEIYIHNKKIKLDDMLSKHRFNDTNHSKS